MKLFMAVLFATLALNGVLSLPARTEDAEVIGGPRRILTRADDDEDDDDFTNFKGVIDTGSGYPFLQPNPSVTRVGFFSSFDDILRSFTDRLFPSSLFSRAGTDSNEDDPFAITPFDSKKANNTSTVKVVDGHKVEINETVYGDENSLFKVRVVNIRPLEEGETVEETENKDIKPVTQGPQDKTPETESNESDEKREPLEKKPLENEIQGNIDELNEKEHSIAKKENIVETAGETTTTAIIIDTTMLPTTEDINAAFVTDNGLEQGEELEGYTTANVAEEELNGDNGNGNNEFETNMSEENNNNNNNYDADDNIDNVENLQVEHTIENNEDTEEEVNDNLNESSSSSNDAADVFDNNPENNDNNDADVVDDAAAATGTVADIEIVNLKKKNSNYLAAIRNKEREDESSSDDEDANATAFEMHPTFNDEWGSLNEPTNEQNDLSNDIDAYDVVPIDLSNDIAVNDAANLPLNPDAEFIDVYGVQHSSNSMPKFEKLSLDYEPSSAEEWLDKPAK